MLRVLDLVVAAQASYALVSAARPDRSKMLLHIATHESCNSADAAGFCRFALKLKHGSHKVQLPMCGRAVAWMLRRRRI